MSDPTSLKSYTSFDILARASTQKLWLKLDDADRANIKEVDQLTINRLDELVAAISSASRSFTESNRFFESPERLERAQHSLLNYFAHLTIGQYEETYVADRLATGLTHYHLGLDPKWYTESYKCVLEWFIQIIRQHCHDDPRKGERLLDSFLKVFFFDMSLAIESYMQAKEQSAENHRDAFAELEAEKRMLLQQQRDDFVATLTHDLKTPIVAANRAMKLLIDGEVGPISAGQANVLSKILESNDALQKMVQTLLDAYRYDGGAKKLELRSEDISKRALAVIEQLSPLAQAKNIRVQTDFSTPLKAVTCDGIEIRRVIQNLLDNSLKFTPVNGEIKLTIEQTDEQTLVSIQDNGAGIPTEDIAKLFQRFWQTSSGGKYNAGTGLGLYLCRKIVEAHGGTISCESEFGKGSSFKFKLWNKLRS